MPIHIPHRASWVTFCIAIAFVLLSSASGVGLTLLYHKTVVSLCSGAVLFPLCYLGARKIWIGVGIVCELRSQGLHGVVTEAAQVYRKAIRAARNGEPLPDVDDHLRPGGSVAVAMYTIVAALHGFVLGFMSGEPSIVHPALVFGCGGMGLGIALYLLVRFGYINLWQSSEDPMFETRTDPWRQGNDEAAHRDS